MKSGLLVCSGTKSNKNIGDYIQSIAAEQFIPGEEYTFIEREELKFYNFSEPVKTIMNGWFMHHPENWPPAKCIEPLFTSFHIVPRNAEKLLSNENIPYFKQYEPIGCRDYNTLRLLEAKGIQTYFSGCLTLTLNNTCKEKNNKIIFVDPYYESYKNSNGKISLPVFLSNFIYYIFHFSKLSRLRKIITTENVKKSKFGFFKSLLNSAAFYKTYSTFFTDEVLFCSDYVSHSVSQSNFKDNKDKMNYAKALLNKYSKAKFVVTSRIHCALPCLGLETPVIFITSENLTSTKNPIRSPGRFEGLSKLFRVAKYTQHKITSEDEVLKNNGNKIDTNFSFNNKEDYLPLRNNLIEQCKNFYK